MVEAVEPLLHWYEESPGVAFRAAADPVHAENVPVMAGAGLAKMFTCWDVFPTQPLASTTVTV